MQAELQTRHATIETVANARRSWSTRNSVRLILDDGEGHLGLGEAAPLPGLSPETASEARRALAKVEWPTRAPRTLAEVHAVVETIDPMLPSARFAAETALASMVASVHDAPLWSLWVESAPDQIGVAATLWSDDPEALQASVAEAAAFEVRTVKVKIGRQHRDTELAILEMVRHALPHAELRLDANRSIPPEELPARLDELAGFSPSFLEEPSDLASTLAQSEPPFALAIDESLWPDPEAQLEEALGCDGVGVVVLKPTLLGGLNRCWMLANRARAAGRRVVISHCLEGAIARAAAAHLALALGDEAAGLGDHPALDALSDGLLVGWIDLAWIDTPEMPGLGLELVW